MKNRIQSASGREKTEKTNRKLINNNNHWTVCTSFNVWKRKRLGTIKSWNVSQAKMHSLFLLKQNTINKNLPFKKKQCILLAIHSNFQYSFYIFRRHWIYTIDFQWWEPFHCRIPPRRWKKKPVKTEEIFKI